MRQYTIDSNPLNSTITVIDDNDDSCVGEFVLSGEADSKLRFALSEIDHALAESIVFARYHQPTYEQEKMRLTLVAYDLRQVVIEETLRSEGMMV